MRLNCINSSKKVFFVLSLLSFINVFGQAELPMDLERMMADISDAQPQGIVDENPVWLHVNVPIIEEDSDLNNQEKKARTKRLKFQRRFYFKLAKNSSFTGDVYESGAKRYSFYSPYEHLTEGKWYWTYGIADPDTPGEPVWSSDIYEFEITGEERLTPIPPKPEVVLNAAMSRPFPVTNLFHEELGELMPTERWPELADFILKKANDNVEKDLDMTFDVSDQNAIDKGKENAEVIFFRKEINGEYTSRNRYLKELMSAYLLTGRNDIRDMVIKKADKLWEFRETAEFEIESLDTILKLKDNDWGNDKPKASFLEFLSEAFTEEERQELIDDVYPEDHTAPEKAEVAEHVLYSQHLWQQIDDYVVRPIRYSNFTEQAREEFLYGYELWLYRAPSLSRTDGGSQEGDGYIGVHDDYLGFIPWLLYKLTGHNYYKGHPWFQNLGKYLTYTNASATLPVSFCDGDGPAASMPNAMEVMATIDSENYWAKYRFSKLPQRYFKNVASDLGKKNMGMGRLSLWKYFDEPDKNVDDPDVLAAEFRDIGEVAMNTNFEDTDENWHLTFHSSPYGSLQHTHPAQNAFNMSYGGEDMFWKVGFYNGGQPHNVLNYKSSRAHNTIMADSLTQGFHSSAYGWMPRFVTGNKISYALGDASNAYNGQHWYIDRRGRYKDEDGNDEITRESKEENQVYHTREFGFGVPGVTRFRRHVVMLRPNYVVIYDELESEEPISWQFNLHSRRFMKKLDDDWLMATNGEGAASAKLFCSSETTTTLDSEWLTNSKEDGFEEPAKNKYWLLKPWDDENKLPDPIPNHYHGTIGTAQKHDKMRFLTLIEIHPGETDSFEPDEISSSQGTDGLTTIVAGDYTINVELDGTKDSFLEIINSVDKTGLLTGTGSENIVVDGKTYTVAQNGATLLIEDGKSTEEVDKYPDALIYGNKF